MLPYGSQASDKVEEPECAKQIRRENQARRSQTAEAEGTNQTASASGAKSNRTIGLKGTKRKPCQTSEQKQEANSSTKRCRAETVPSQWRHRATKSPNGKVPSAKPESHHRTAPCRKARPPLKTIVERRDPPLKTIIGRGDPPLKTIVGRCDPPLKTIVRRSNPPLIFSAQINPF